MGAADDEYLRHASEREGFEGPFEERDVAHGEEASRGVEGEGRETAVEAVGEDDGL